MPLIDATTGFSSRRRFRTTAPVIRVNCEHALDVALEQLADDLVDVAARAEALAGAGEDEDAHVSSDWHSHASRSSSAYTSKVSEFSLSGRVKVTVPTPSLTR